MQTLRGKKVKQIDRMCQGRSEEAQVQVIESKTSHLVALEAVSQET